jgi:hypothetical protein
MSRYAPTTIGLARISDPSTELVIDRNTAATDQLPPGCAPVARSLPVPARREPSRWTRLDGAGCQRAAGSTCPCTPGHRRTLSFAAKAHACSGHIPTCPLAPRTRRGPHDSFRGLAATRRTIEVATFRSLRSGSERSSTIDDSELFARRLAVELRLCLDTGGVPTGGQAIRS